MTEDSHKEYCDCMDEEDIAGKCKSYKEAYVPPDGELHPDR